MRFEVKKGMVKWKGVFYPKGSFFDAEKDEVKGLVASAVIATLEIEHFDSSGGIDEGNALSKPNPMTIEAIKQFLETAESVEVVRQLLDAELAREEPRKTAVKLLEDWLKGYQEEDDLQLPNFNSDDAIVDR